MIGAQVPMGYDFQGWAVVLAGIIAHRLRLETTDGSLSGRDALRLHSEVPKASPEGHEKRLDVEVSGRDNRVELNAECKWSERNARDQFLKASEYLHKNAAQTKHHLIIVGTPSSNLDAGCVRDHLESQGYRTTYSYAASTGTSFTRLQSPQGRTTTVVVLVGKALDSEFARAVAIALTVPKPAETGERSLDMLASALMMPLFHSLAAPAESKSTHLDFNKPFETGLPPDAFLADPWSFLAERFLEKQRGREPRKFRWVRLLRLALEERKAPEGPLLPEEHEIAGRIPPLPLRCGRSHRRETIRDLRTAISMSAPSEPLRGNPAVIRILRGPAGTGKSTLLEFLYNNHLEGLWYGGSAARPTSLPVFIDLQRDSKALDRDTASIDRTEDDSDREFAVRAMEQFTDCAGNWLPPGHDAWGRGIGVQGSLLSALLMRFKVSLYVDGFDQLSEAQAIRLRRLGNALKREGFEISYLLLSSRPGYDELQAFDWQETFSLSDPPDSSSTLSLASPERSDVMRYCQAWLDTLYAVGGSAVATEPPRAETFLQWLPSPSIGRADDASAEAIQKNPLLLAMALSVYVLELGKSKSDRLAIRTQTDLIKLLLSKLPSPEHDTSVNRRQREDVGGGRQLRDPVWREWFEHVCFESLRRPGRTTGRIDAELLGNPPTATAKEHNDHIASLRSLPFIEGRQQDSRFPPNVEFLHPLFHEYFAARYLVDRVANNKPLSIGGESIQTDDLAVLRTTGGIVNTPLGELLVALGRETFKCVLGLLVALEEHEPLGRFFDLLDRDYGIQQYLYDAGFVDRAFSELVLAEDKLRGKPGHRCAAKLVGHKHYGTAGELATGIAWMLHVMNDDRSKNLRSWYRIFFLDHIENRYRPDDRGDVLAAAARLHLAPETLPDDLPRWIAEEWRGLTSDLRVFAPIGVVAPGGRTSMLDVPAPEWGKDDRYLLRAAHYWGHVGNRVLRRQSSSSARAGDARGEGLQAYARAVVYRLESLFLSLGRNFDGEVWSALGTQLQLPTWFEARWNRRTDDPTGVPDVEDFERFVGPVQAMADTAVQFSCRADLLLWDVAHEEKHDVSHSALGAAHAELTIARALWDRANRMRGFRGEGLLRYFLHLAGVEERLSLAESVVEGTNLPSVAEVDKRARARLEHLERQYGLRYELAWQDVLNSTAAYRRVFDRY